MRADHHLQQVACEDLDDGAVTALAELLSSASSERSEGDPPVSPAQLAVDERIAPPWLHRTRALAWAPDGRLLATALLEIEDRSDNRHLAWVEVSTAPDARRQGLGRSVLAAVLPAAAAEGRSLLLGGAAAGSPGSAFAASLGLGVGQVEHRNRVRTADLPLDVLRSWRDLPPSGYALLAVDGPLPDDLLAAYAVLARVMNDAPTDDLEIEDVDHSPGELRSLHEAAARRGTTRWTVLARHEASGELAGFTELLIPRHDSWLARQGDTGVVAAHRGHGLGRRLKAVNALRLVEERPDVEVIETWNASTNPHMLAINHDMGFRLAGARELVQGQVAPLLDRLVVRT